MEHLVVVVWRQQSVYSRHCLQADLLMRRQVEYTSWQLWQVLKVDHILLLGPPVVHTVQLAAEL